MRIRSAALLLALLALGLWAGSAPAAQLHVPLTGAKPLKPGPPVPLPAARSRPLRTAAPVAASAPLPNTGIDAPLVAAIGALLLLTGGSIQEGLRAVHRPRP